MNDNEQDILSKLAAGWIMQATINGPGLWAPDDPPGPAREYPVERVVIALERAGLIEWKSAEWFLTDAGRAAIIEE